MKFSTNYLWLKPHLTVIGTTDNFR